MNYERLVKDIIINNIDSLKNLTVNDFKNEYDYDCYMDWSSGRYFNFTSKNTLRSNYLNKIKTGLTEKGFKFKEYNVSVGIFRTVKEIEIIV